MYVCGRDSRAGNKEILGLIYTLFQIGRIASATIYHAGRYGTDGLWPARDSAHKMLVSINDICSVISNVVEPSARLLSTGRDLFCWTAAFNVLMLFFQIYRRSCDATRGKFKRSFEK